ncbi:AmmeMemoRadiSam system radical SAM enzyme [Candidatus Micrarchaeota archaeon]|nr:MAG: AmmeMemoRadiSam system radical SAM enzyme [Candidatus Micrarchaeota archaeon]
MRKISLQSKVKGIPRCNWCYHRCVIPEGKTGICHNNININGELYSQVYGKAVSMAVDPIEKKPLYHFLPGTTAFSIATTGCNFRCKHCQNWEISQAKPGDLPTHDAMPEDIVEMAVRTASSSIAYTYNEPTVFFDYAHDTGILARKKGLKNIFVTNGYMTPEAVELAAKDFLDASNIDIKGDENFYRKVVGADYNNVLENVKNQYKAGIFIEVTTLIIPGFNDNADFIREIAAFLKSLSKDIPWHFSAFYPAYQMRDVPPTPRETILKMCEIAKDEGMHYVYAGNIWDSGYDNSYCPYCGALLVRRKGYDVELLIHENKCPNCGRKLNFVLK